MNKEQAIKLAKSIVKKNGWDWKEPYHIKSYKKYIFFGDRIWHIITNSNYKGYNVIIKIHSNTGTILKNNFIKRSNIDYIRPLKRGCPPRHPLSINPAI